MMPQCLPAYLDSNGCTINPACPGIDAIPSAIVQRSALGWNAGANSIASLPTNLHVVFTMPAGVVGEIIGLRAGRSQSSRPDLIEHGLYFSAVAGIDLVRVIESGVNKTAAITRSSGDSFEVRRVNGSVTYWRNSQLLYASTQPSTGTKVVNACLFASGDSV